MAGVWLPTKAPGRVPGSSVSLAPDGWLAARRYLEARGGRVTLLDDESSDARGVLVVVFPWQRFDPSLGLARIRRHLHGGGALVFAYSGRSSWAEPAVAAAIGMGHEEAQAGPPLHPLRWREEAAASSSLAPEADAAGLAPLRVSKARAWVTPPRGATILFRDEGGRPAAFSYRHGAGRVFAVPASAFSNARIAQDGNADLVESLLRGLGPEWAFDEFHHGLVSGTADATASMRALDAFLLQLAFVYVLAVLAVARRFGPAWDEPPVVAGSTASFLRGVGALHHRLGHHRDAAALLVDRVRQLYPRLAVPEPAPDDAGAVELLSLAQGVGRAQTGEERKT